MTKGPSEKERDRWMSLDDMNKVVGHPFLNGNQACDNMRMENDPPEAGGPFRLDLFKKSKQQRSGAVKPLSKEKHKF